MRHTKIIATVGPTSSSDAMLDQLITSGVDIFRLNFSHGEHETHASTLARIRTAAARAKRDVAILQDLSGPKIRTGTLEGHKPLPLKPGDSLKIVTGDFVGAPGRVSTTFDGLARSVKRGDRLLLADGLVELRVEATDGKEIRTTVVEGKELGEHKGITAPGVALPTSAITAKDVDDLIFGLSLGIDMVAVSFVQTAADLTRARQVAAEHNGATLPIIAKLERPQALDHLNDILASCDGVMVARGDLGLELPFERVPGVQKAITREGRRRGIPVIVATQVLESMTVEPRPTRAEANDAANAVEDGVDAIMLAGETAVGKFPVRAVQALDAIICDAERRLTSDAAISAEALDDHAQALCEGAVTLANRGDAQAIVAVTRGGSTARRLSALRPRAPILAATNRDDTLRRLALYWGVVPFRMDVGEDFGAASEHIGAKLIAAGFVEPGASVVFVSVSPDRSRRDVNYVKLQRL